MSQRPISKKVNRKLTKTAGRPHGGGKGPFVRRESEASASSALQKTKTVELPSRMTVGELAEILGIPTVQLISELIKHNILRSVNQHIDYDEAAVVAMDMGYEVREPAPAEELLAQAAGAVESKNGMREEEAGPLVERPPVVTVMGHVDHGKTSLLDAIRRTNVTAREAGGITQHIGAYQVEVHGRKITFLDTPGHEAFTAMRARGAQVTDVAVLVVAADDGVMPQTKEAVDHARAAGVPIVVALNKIDKPNANPDRVKQQLSEIGVVVEEYGGDVPIVPVSAKRREGLDHLLEMILLVADIAELKADPNRPASGTVIEAKLDKARGPVATVLVQNGTLRVGDLVVAGAVTGKVKALFDFRNRRIKSAEPSTPVEILGLDGVPQAGDRMQVVPDEKTARAIASAVQRAAEKEAATREEISLEDVFSKLQEGQVKELNVIVKTDVQGSVEPIVKSLEGLQAEGLRVKVLHAGTGNITESDVMLATASRAIIVGFNVRTEPGARNTAEAQGVEIRNYSVIYNLVDDVRKALTGLLEPEWKETVEGHCQVRQVFKIGKGGAAAGCYVTDGRVTRNSLVRVLRGGETIFTGKVASLRRVKEDVREVAAGYECGIVLDGFNDFREGDVIETFIREKVAVVA